MQAIVFLATRVFLVRTIIIGTGPIVVSGKCCKPTAARDNFVILSS